MEEMKSVYSEDKTVRFIMNKDNQDIPKFTYQPERLNPEDKDWYGTKAVIK